MSDDLQIPARDQEKIDGMVAQYRHALENLYRLAWLQGSMDAMDDAARKLKVRT